MFFTCGTIRKMNRTRTLFVGLVFAGTIALAFCAWRMLGDADRLPASLDLRWSGGHSRLRNQQRTNRSTLTACTVADRSKPNERYGIPIRGKNHIVICNSVPKCGSRTLADIVVRTFRKNNDSIPLIKLQDEEGVYNKDKFIKAVKNSTAPVFIKGHTNFYSLNTLRPEPIYINFIRDPVARFVSSYYFTRFGDHRPDSAVRRKEHIGWRNVTIEECIEGGVRCDRGTYRSFCGYMEKCRSDPAWALAKAKQNVDRSYTFVGIVEEYENSLRVLERLMPDLFRGLVEVYHTPSLSNRTEITKTKFKQELSEGMKRKARGFMNEEYEFYYYVYDKFTRLKMRYRID